jgi:hypothetical protein
VVTCRSDLEHDKSTQNFTDSSNVRLQLSSRLMALQHVDSKAAAFRPVLRTQS